MASALSPLLDALRQFKLLTSAQLKEVENPPSSISDPKALAKELMQRGWLTPYQANLLLQGKGQELLLGSYVLLERLGEGGMGEVFKARNWKLGKVVALKLIHKERVANPDAVKRFQREVRAAAQLSHPNVVMAYDADEVGGTHLLVMEYVEGSDLAGLVKKQGPLPVDQACDFIRQAALALQHAFEKGLVHRDIKPANLLLAKGNVVKILDMGLARHDGADDKSSTMTQEGSVMGTPDYIAPEQAMDSHTVDIRGDIYSLGCTFYFLLTAKVPFPGGTMMEKLLKHRLQEPTPVEQLRPGVPSGVVAVLRKMMAKTPEERYQTPGAVAEALLALGGGGLPVQYQDERTMAEQGVAQRATPVAVGETGDTMEALAASRKQSRETEQRRWRRLTVAGGGLLLGAVAVFVGLLFWQRSPQQEAKTTAGSPPVVEGPRNSSKKVDDAWLKQVAALPVEKQGEAVVAKLKELNRDFDGNLLAPPRIENGVVTELRFVTDNVTDISPVRALIGLRSLDCSGSPGKGRLADLSPLKDMKLTTLLCNATQVADLSPLKGMPLTNLSCHGTQVSDLSPLKGLPLTDVYCHYTKVSDLSPLKDMKLTTLFCAQTQVADLSPLKGMNLTSLMSNNTQVSDLSPLRDMKLTKLWCNNTQVSDLSPLKGMSLKALWCDFRFYRDTELLRSIKSLETINGKPEKEFWNEVELKQAAFEAWLKQVAMMPAEKQGEAVAAKLKELNPGFEGKLTEPAKIENGVVTELRFVTDNVTDISPVRALTGLKVLECNGSATGKGKLADLSPLKEMKLTVLRCTNTRVSDLSPLKEMKLTYLYCNGTQVSDLSPLKDMKLITLNCANTQVADLSPLKDMKLTSLWCDQTKVSDLSPLKDMKLTSLWCYHTQVVDLTPLKDMKLTMLMCHGTKVSDLSPLQGMELEDLRFTPKNITKGVDVLRQMKSLKTIGTGYTDKDKWPADEFWKKLEAGEFKQKGVDEAWLKQVAAMPAEKQGEAVAAKLKELNPDFDGKLSAPPRIANGVVTELKFSTDKVTDISPVRALTGLKMLECIGSTASKGKLADLSPLKDMKLTHLGCYYTQVSDLSPLKDMKLVYLQFAGTQVSDLSPLKGMPLTELHCHDSQVSSLSPLKGMKLTVLSCGNTQVSDLTPLTGMPLTHLRCNGTQVADLSPLTGIPLTRLYCQATPVVDLSPLKDMKLTSLDCGITKVSDLSPLKGMPLTVLYCYSTPVADLTPLHGMQLEDIRFTPRTITKGMEVLRQMKSLKTIGFSWERNWPAAEFWKKLEAGDFK